MQTPTRRAGGYRAHGSRLIIALLLLVTVHLGCGEEARGNTPGEFGSPCLERAGTGTSDGCIEGLKCWKGYCEEICVVSDDCQPVDGWTHECVSGQCRIYCDAESSCPQLLDTPMECRLDGMLCVAKD